MLVTMEGAAVKASVAPLHFATAALVVKFNMRWNKI